MSQRPPITHVQLLIFTASVLIFGVLAGAVWGRQSVLRMASVNPSDATELAALQQKYGRSRNSENAEEWILRDFFGDRRGGVFVDVGANHYRSYSNTYFLETALGWSGVAIEPQTQFAEGYRLHRPRTAFVPLFVSDVSDGNATLYVASNHLVASNSREFTEAFGERATAQEVRTTTLDDALDRLKIAKVDFLSMDIELAEPQALAGFSIGRFTPALVAVEAHPPVRQQILDYFVRHQYTLVGKYWRIDRENFWFAPLGTADRVAAHRD